MTELDDWADFLAFASHRSDGAWLFRATPADGTGEVDDHRPAVGAPGYDRAEELIAFEDFVAAASRDVDPSGRMTRLEWLLLGDRHGLPTRVIVWTPNPLAALARALRRTRETDDLDLHAVRVPRDRRVRDCDPFAPAASGDLSGVTFVTAPDGDDVIAVHGEPDRDWRPQEAALAVDRLRLPARSRSFVAARLRVFGQDGSEPGERLSAVAGDIARRQAAWPRWRVPT